MFFNKARQAFKKTQGFFRSNIGNVNKNLLQGSKKLKQIEGLTQSAKPFLGSYYDPITNIVKKSSDVIDNIVIPRTQFLENQNVLF